MKRLSSLISAILISVSAFSQNYDHYGNVIRHTYDDYTRRTSSYDYDRPYREDQTLVEMGGTAQLFLPSYINELQPKSVKFLSNDYITVTQQSRTDCTIKGIRPGAAVQVVCRYAWETTVNGQRRNHEDVYVFNVRVTRIDPENVLLPQLIEVGWGQTVMLRPELYPENASCGFSYRSGNTDIAQVQTNGLIKGLKLGETTITVTTTNGVSAETLLKVILPPCEKIEFRAQDTGSFSTVGDEMDFIPVIRPENAQPKYEWSSSDDSVIQIDSKGHAKIVGAGRAAIWIRTDNGKQYYKNFNVKAPKK